MIRLLFGVACATILATGSAQAALLFSDNFESETLMTNGSLSNWTISDGTIDVVGAPPPFFDFYPGNGKYVDLDGSSGNAGKITTNSTFTFLSGVTYILQYELGGSTRGDTNSVTVSVGSMLNLVQTLGSSFPLTVFSHSFLGDGSTQSIMFDHAGGDNLGLLLDDVSLTRVEALSVPEPASLALFGLGAAGLVGFRRRRAA